MVRSQPFFEKDELDTEIRQCILTPTHTGPQTPALSPTAPPGRMGRTPHPASPFKVWGGDECSGRSSKA